MYAAPVSSTRLSQVDAALFGKKVFPYLDECIIINGAVILTERQGGYGEKDRSERHIGKGAER